MLKQDVREVIARQQVERVCPPAPFWSKALLIAGGIVVGWMLILVFLGGVVYWLDTIAEWLA